MQKGYSLVFLLFFAFVFAVQGQYLNSVSYLTAYSEQQISNMGLNATYGVEVYKVTYQSTDPHGSSTIASGALLIPDVDTCDHFPLVSYQHGTVFKDDKVPSRMESNNIQGLFFSTEGYVVTMPDYFGLGDDPGIHPYVHGESEAIASRDLMRAAREYFQDSIPENLNGEVFLTGYSQGGHSTMALHKHLQQDSLLSEFNIVASAPLSGPYNLSGVQAEFPSDSVYTSPSYFAYIIASYEYVYGTIYDSLPQMYDSPYDTLIPKYLTGDSTLSSFNQALPNNLYDFFQDSVLDNFRADTVQPFTHPIKIALADNDNHDWAPQAPVTMAYCTGDQQVFYENAIIARDSMQANGASNVSAVNRGGVGHGQCVIPALSGAKQWFDGLMTSCVSTSGIPEKQLAELKMKKQGLSNGVKVTIQNIRSSGKLELFAITGRQVMKRTLSPEQARRGIELTSQELDSGIYLVRFVEDGEQVGKKVVIHD